MLPFTITVLALIFIATRLAIVVSEREQAVKERLGKFQGVLPAGLHFMIPGLDRVVKRHDMREQAIDVPSQSCITRDNIQVEVDGIVYLKIFDAQQATYGIDDYRLASINLAQTTMRSEIGKLDLDQTFSERQQINESIVRQIDEASDPWGVKITRYEIMNISPSRRVIDTMEKQMEAERAKRAEITISTGNKEAQIQLSQAERQESVNLSEGERQRRINEAEGRAAEIRLVANATAQGISMIAESIRKPGGRQAVQTQIVERYIQEFGRITKGATVSVVPNELANIQGVFQGIGETSRTLASPPHRKG